MPHRTYRMCSAPGRYSTGRLHDGRQVLMGVSCPDFELYFFDKDGSLLSCETRQLSKPPLNRDGVYLFDSDAELSLNTDVARWSNELGFTESPIQVVRFAAGNACIEDFPAEIMELHDHPEHFDDEERQVLLKWKHDWIESGLYAFWWGDELWIDRDGTINSS